MAINIAEKELLLGNIDYLPLNGKVIYMNEMTNNETVVVNKRGEYLYLLVYAVIGSGYESISYKLFYAENNKDLEKQIDIFLRNYFQLPEDMVNNEDIYYCRKLNVGVRYLSSVRIKNFEHLISLLL
jgi:hypothetical protein